MERERLHTCQAILFDFGGTLDSDGEHWLDRFIEMYRAAGLTFSSDEIKHAFYYADDVCYGNEQVFSLGLRPLVEYHVRVQFSVLNLKDDEKARLLARQFCSRSEYYLRRNATILARLKNRYRLGVVSNFYGNVSSLCKEAGMDASLAVIVDSARVGVCKPQPEIFRIALDQLRCDSQHVLFVGDSYERDMIPARDLGFRTVWMRGPHPRVPVNAGPVDAWISTLTDLEALLI